MRLNILFVFIRPPLPRSLELEAVFMSTHP
jgi:hypothetical protein